MGFLNFFSKADSAQLLPLPSGSFTLDRDAVIIASTVPQSFPQDRLRDIGKLVLGALISAKAANLPIAELIVDYAAFRLTARELRGGAMIFFSPLTPVQKQIESP